MANAKKCDRCKGFYDNLNDNPGKINFYVKAFRVTPYGEQFERDFDLCPACEKELENFVNTVPEFQLVSQKK